MGVQFLILGKHDEISVNQEFVDLCKLYNSVLGSRVDRQVYRATRVACREGINLKNNHKIKYHH